MASRLCRETQTSLCIKNPANITAIRKQQQQYQYLAPVCMREIFIFSCYNTGYLGDQSEESEGIWGSYYLEKCTIFIRYTDSAYYYTLISRYVLSIKYICYRLFTNFQNFLFFPLRELQKRIQGEHVLHSSGLLQEETPQKYSKYQNFCFTIKFDILLI